MKSHLLALICGIALVAAALPVAIGAESEPTVPASGTGEKAGREDGDELVCRKEAPIGSRIRKTVCRKRSDIEESSANARELLNRRKHGNRG